MHYPVIFAVKLTACILSFLPRRQSLALGEALGSFLRFAGFRRKIVEENLSLALPSLPGVEREALIRANYRHYGILFLDFWQSFWKQEDFLRRYVDVEGEENIRAALAEGKGVLVLTAHVGNWEALTAHGTTVLKVPATMVTKRLKPAWLHDFIEKERARLGVKMAFEPKTLSVVLRALQKKEIVGFVMDQYAGAPVGARVPFFGIPVGSHTALAMLALRTEAVVVPAVAYRKPDGRYSARFEKPLPLQRSADREEELLLNTAAFVRRTEEWVREFPEQWLWIHRRWKGDLSPLPPGAIGQILK